jgi:hypothetical protein
MVSTILDTTRYSGKNHVLDRILNLTELYYDRKIGFYASNLIIYESNVARNQTDGWIHTVDKCIDELMISARRDHYLLCNIQQYAVPILVVTDKRQGVASKCS